MTHKIWSYKFRLYSPVSCALLVRYLRLKDSSTCYAADTCFIHSASSMVSGKYC